MSPRKRPFPPGTVERMEELLATGELGENERERVLSIRLLALGRTGPDVAQVVGRDAETVYRYKRNFLAEGEQALRTEGWGGRRNEVLGVEQEQQFVAGFQQAAERGELVSAADMIAALAEQTGRQVNPSTMYQMLKRCGWRKVVPRPTHPDGDPERREAFKQTSQR